MESLAPTLQCLIEVQSAIRNGETVRVGVARFLNKRSPRDEFANAVRIFLLCWDQGRDWRANVPAQGSYRSALLEILNGGLQGQPISAHLDALKTEVELACDAEIREHLELLPVKMLAPLLLFQFPAFLLLMFGPLLRHLIEEINR